MVCGLRSWTCSFHAPPSARRAATILLDVLAAKAVLTGNALHDQESVRRAGGDAGSFIRAMHEISGWFASALIDGLGPLGFSHLLDIGGASGTRTLPFLQRNPGAKATIFDLPEVSPLAADVTAAPGTKGRIRLVAGDYLADDLLAGADLAWGSAVVHQRSREQNRALFLRIITTLVPGGTVLIRGVEGEGGVHAAIVKLNPLSDPLGAAAEHHWATSRSDS
jgi:hypothetical protein